MKKTARDRDPRTREPKSSANSKRTNPNLIGWCKMQRVTEMRTKPTRRRSRQSWYGENWEKENAVFQIEVKEQETAERIIDDLSSGEPSVVRLQPYDPTLEKQTWHGQRMRSSEMQEETKSRLQNLSAQPVQERLLKMERKMRTRAVGTQAWHPMTMRPWRQVVSEQRMDGWDVCDMTMDAPNNEALEWEKRQRQMLMGRSAEEA